MLAECIVAVGAMLIPLAVVLLVTIDNFPSTWAQSLIISGAIALIIGLVIAIRDEVRTTKREKLRRRIDKSVLIVLAHMAEKLGVDMTEIANMLEERLDDESEDGL